jgi:hypothetical protein
MSQKQKLRLLLLVVLALPAFVACVHWLVGSHNKPPSEAVHDSDSALAQAQAVGDDPQSIDLVDMAAGNDTITDAVPTDDRSAFVQQLLEKGLALEPNPRKVAKKFVRDLSVEELIGELGHAWTSSTPFCGIARNETSIAWLRYSLMSNLRVKRVILEGRKNPERVGSLVCTDLMRRTNQWQDTVQAYEDAYHEKGSLRYLVGDNGKKVASGAFEKYCQDKYAIPADIFILMNIDYSKGLDTLVDFADWMFSVPKRMVQTPDGPYTYWQLDTRGPYGGKPVRKRLNGDMVFYAVAMYLQNNADPKYQSAREALEKVLKGKPACTEDTTDTPEALWPADDALIMAAGVDNSAEPKMTLLLPNLEIIEDKDRWFFDTRTVCYGLIEAHNSQTSAHGDLSADPTEQSSASDIGQQADGEHPG